MLSKDYLIQGLHFILRFCGTSLRKKGAVICWSRRDPVAECAPSTREDEVDLQRQDQAFREERTARRGISTAKTKPPKNFDCTAVYSPEGETICSVRLIKPRS
jgi:hypothetical protein